jgi:hypothetical protein
MNLAIHRICGQRRIRHSRIHQGFIRFFLKRDLSSVFAKMKPFMAGASASAAALLGYILLLVPLPFAFALNGDPSKTSLNTYAGWKSFEVVTQGDKLGGYTVPGQMDGIGVSCLVFCIV